MRYPKHNNELFIKNRTKLANSIEKNSLAIVYGNSNIIRNGDQHYTFRQNSDFYYLCGIEQEDCILVIFPHHPVKDFREILFIKKQSTKEIIYDGEKLNSKSASEISGVKNVLSTDSFERTFKEFLYFAERVYVPQIEYPGTTYINTDKNLEFANKLRKEFPALELKRLEPILTKLRVIKEPDELELMQHACDITEKAFHKILRFVKPGEMEYKVEAEITYEFHKNRANGHAYQPIIASGINACTLHYIQNNSECQEGDLLLMDFGAEYANYAADCTRTIPVNGRFSPRQRGVYQAVLNVFYQARDLYVPGTTIAEIDKKVAKFMEKELIELGLFSKDDVKVQDPEAPLYKEYLPHGIAHFLGLDVHDVGSKYIKLEEGMVITCEPGIYIHEENIGIRLENDIVVSKTPIDLMENIPIEIDEIETLMSKGIYKED